MIMATLLAVKTLMPTVRLPAQAPALVLLHGWGATSAVWEPVLPLLRAFFKITLIDLPGFGESRAQDCGDSLADWRDAVLRAAPPQAIWMGWSLGGLVATAVGHHAPERVVALALVAANPCFVQRPDWPNAMSPLVFEQFRAQAQAQPAQALGRFHALQCMGSATVKDDLRFLQRQLRSDAATDAAMMSGLRLLADSDVRDDLAALEPPLLALLGERDQLVPAQLQEDLQALNAAADIAVIPGSAHLPFVSQPAAFAERFLAFCRRQEVLA